jgi:hypothetical protein
MKPKPFLLCAAIFALTLTPVFATTPGPSPHDHLEESFAARPDNPSDRINLRAIERSVERLMSIPTTAGAKVVVPTTTAGADVSKQVQEVETRRESEWFRYPSFFVEYNFIHSNDEREFGPDGDTHSGQIGFDCMIPADILVGITYSYSNTDLDHNLPIGSESDSHFVSAYLGKSFAGWVNVGVSGGGGTSHVEPEGAPDSDIDTWSVTPYVGLFHSWGSFSFSSTATYLHQDSDSASSTGKVTVDLNLKYAVTERFSIASITRYTESVDYDDTVSEDRNWVTFGGKLNLKATQRVGLYGGYEYDAFNHDYENHTGRGGVSVEF